MVNDSSKRDGGNWNPREALKLLVPPLLIHAVRRINRTAVRFSGQYIDWVDASAQSSGYSTDHILTSVIEATRAVVTGRAAYERDSVLFHVPATPFHIVAGLLRSAAQDGGRLHVIDVGGSLGSTYRQCRSFLSVLPRIEWHVVEQSGFVAAGRAEFSTAELKFHESVREIPIAEVRATFLLSSSLQYLESPLALLDQLTARPARHLLLDRTPLSDLTTDRLCVQQASNSVYDASYPCWIFSRERLLERLAPHWRLVAEHPCPEGRQRTDDGLTFEFRGVILERLP